MVIVSLNNFLHKHAADVLFAEFIFHIQLVKLGNRPFDITPNLAALRRDPGDNVSALHTTLDSQRAGNTMPTHSRPPKQSARPAFLANMEPTAFITNILPTVRDYWLSLHAELL